MDQRKLYAATIETVLYCLADPADENSLLEEFVREHLSRCDGRDLISSVREVVPGHRVDPMWSDSYAVPYGSDGETLQQCLDAIPGFREAETAQRAKIAALQAKAAALRAKAKAEAEAETTPRDRLVAAMRKAEDALASVVSAMDSPTLSDPRLKYIECQHDISCADDARAALEALRDVLMLPKGTT